MRRTFVRVNVINKICIFPLLQNPLKNNRSKRFVFVFVLYHIKTTEFCAGKHNLVGNVRHSNMEYQISTGV